MQKKTLIIALAALLHFPTFAFSQESEKQYATKIHKASDEGEKAIQRIRRPDDVHISLFAAEPLLANPVAFCIDEKGRFYVAETFRLHAGATDNRKHMYWLNDDLASRTVADRVAMYRKHLKKKFNTYAIDHDRVRLIVDENGDGKADWAKVFADGFKNAADGIGSGVLARNGDVYYACIPDLWLLRDKNGDGHADVRQSLQNGYGVHVAFLGHDLHGLKFGPDSKLYFTIGDRGFHVETKDRLISNPDSGAVLRCNPDGSELEIVHVGLRNPQEIAFDEFGNLFTGDNNADGGDRARWVQIVDGGDSGWRIGYQYLKKYLQWNIALGTWSAEKIWHLEHDAQPASHLPPLAHLGNGPSGLTYHPGTSLLPKRYERHFFLCDFRGGSPNSGIHAFTVKPKGATFAIVPKSKKRLAEEFVWTTLATDCDFGPDGALYYTDWTEGWGLPFKGRIYKVFSPTQAKQPVIGEVKELLAAGFKQRSIDELAALLKHADMRIRQEAQFALAEKNAVAALESVAKKAPQLARLHAVWGLGQIGRRDKVGYRSLKALVDDDDIQVRSQAIKVLGESRDEKICAKIVPHLQDAEPRVQFFAAMSIAKLAAADKVPSDAFTAVVEMLRTNADQDKYLRHAGVMALAAARDPKVRERAANDKSPSVRLAALLAMRRLQSVNAAKFLTDVEPRLAAEAARAVYDVPIANAMPQLAAMITSPIANDDKAKPFRDALWLRILQANYRMGTTDTANALARFAARKDAPDPLRLEALHLLGEWQKPRGRDRVVGLWRPLSERPKQDAMAALRSVLGSVMTASNVVRAEGSRIAAKLGITEIGPTLRSFVTDVKQPSRVRVDSLLALESLNDGQLAVIAKLAADSKEPRLKHHGMRISLKTKKLTDAVNTWTQVVADDKRSFVERQLAFEQLGKVKHASADQKLSEWLDRVIIGKAPPELQLDILQAANERGSQMLKVKLAAYESMRTSDPVGQYRESLQGGDAESGKRLFFQKAALSCMRCHKINGQGGDVGPDLSDVGGKQKRDYILRSLVAPSADFAKGYETTVVLLKNGKFFTGIVTKDTKRTLEVVTAEGNVITVPKDLIEKRGKGTKSGMPDDLIRYMSRAELRDLVEFLASLRARAKE